MAQLKNTTISDTGFLQLPVGTTAQRPSPAAGQMRFNTNAGKAEFYNATASAWLGTAATGVIATGGNSVYDVDVEGTTYRVHVFTNAGNSSFTVSKGGPVEYLIVAGGGAGGGGGGAGGAGGLLTGTTTVTPQSYTITVGTGGIGVATGATGANGQNSSALGVTAIRGGGGGALNGVPQSGGSGGGGTRATPAGGAGTAGQGNAGGNGTQNSGAAWTVGGGGGGAGWLGQNGNVRGTDLPGNGGVGLVSFLSGIAAFYAGGGGGGTQAGTRNGGAGGLGGGSAGGQGTAIAPNATPNTGGGGGSGNESGSTFARSGDGGSGVVIVRYPLRQENPVAAAGKTIGDGVVLDLDFAKPTVYAGAGTTVSDSRLNGITGTLINSPVFADPRTHRSSFTFNGVDNYIQLPSTTMISSAAAVSSWINIEDFVTGKTSPGRIFVRLAGANFFSMVAFYSGGFSFEVNTNSNPHELASRTTGNVTDAAISAGSWFHFTLVFSSNSFIGYINGTQRGTAGISDNLTFDRIGDGTSIPDNYPGFFKGRIANFQVFNKSITSTEVAQQYNATRWRFGV